MIKLVNRLFLLATILALAVFIAVGTTQESFGKGAPPGPGTGPPDPPRDTPGLDPISLAAMAGASYVGYRFFGKNKDKTGKGEK